MKLSRERKVLLAVALLGVSSLLIDRFVLGSGQTDPDAAQAAVDAKAPAAAPAKAAYKASDPADAGSSIAALLRSAEQAHPQLLEQSREGFKPSDQWLGETTVIEQDNGRDPVVVFTESHTLSAVMNGRIAIVDGQAYRVGDLVDGFELVAVSRNTADFQRNHLMARLTLMTEGVGP